MDHILEFAFDALAALVALHVWFIVLKPIYKNVPGLKQAMGD